MGHEPSLTARMRAWKRPGGPAVTVRETRFARADHDLDGLAAPEAGPVDRERVLVGH